jgi:hypothetical protein
MFSFFTPAAPSSAEAVVCHLFPNGLRKKILRNDENPLLAERNPGRKDILDGGEASREN